MREGIKEVSGSEYRVSGKRMFSKIGLIFLKAEITDYGRDCKGFQ